MGKIVEEMVEKIKECANDVYKELGGEWSESVYQEAMEVALREAKISYDTQRILPVIYKGFVVGSGKPDLVIWVKDGKKRIGIVVDLKAETNIKEDHIQQVSKYIEGLRKELKEDEEVYEKGLVINFKKSSSKKVSEERVEELDGIEIAEVIKKIK
jgi:GxxExxY protein